jgi:hypothetical protein
MTIAFADKGAQKILPGYLLAPLDWAAAPLLAILCADEALTMQVLQIGRPRMHLIALALAHCGGARQMPSAELLLRGSLERVTDAVLQRRPPGLKRALEHLPVQVLPAATYRQLVELLDEPAVAKLIHHAHFLTREYIEALHETPQPLRRLVASAKQAFGIELEGLARGLRILAQRGAAPSFDALVEKLASTRQAAQFVARLRNLVLNLPPVPFSLPAVIGGARRIDDVGQISRLAKQWKNCLETIYLDSVIEYRAAVYLWLDEEAPAACVVTWQGRMGWALEDAKGPDNAELPPDRFNRIVKAFADAGIPRLADVGSLIVLARRTRSDYRARRNRDRRAHEQCVLEEMYMEFEQALP